MVMLWFSPSCLTLLQLHGLLPTRLLNLCDFLGNITGVVCHFFPPGDFSKPGIKPASLCLLHYKQILYC